MESKIEQIENKENLNIEEKKEEKIEDKKENIPPKEEINEVKEKEMKEESKEESKEETSKNNTEDKKEENGNINTEKIIENKNPNDTIAKKEETPKTEEIENTNFEQKSDKQNDEKTNKENIEEQPKKEETKTEEILKEEPKIIKEEKENPEEKKNLSEEKPKEEIKLDENKKTEIKEEKKEIPIKSNDTKNENEEKKEEIKQIKENNNTEIKKENTEEKKAENIKKNDGKKKTGIKSKISKFRKNFGKNKNKDGGFEFELVTEKKKDKENPPEDIKKNIKEEINKENVEEKKIEEKPKEDINKDIEEKKQEEIKKIEDKPKEEIKEEKSEQINQETKIEKPKEEIKEEIKQKETELTPKNDQKIEQKEELTKEEPKKEEIPKEKPKDEIIEKPKEDTKEKPKEDIKIETKEEIKQETQKKEEIKMEPKEEIKQETKPKEPETNILQESKPKEEIKPQEKTSESNNKELFNETSEEKQNNNTPPQSPPEENPETNKKSLGINQESLNEFEKKLQLALEQEAKDKNSNENLVDPTPAPIKQKKEDPKFDEIKSKLGKEIVDSLFSPKWETKKHGFELINEFINSNTKDKYNISELIEYIKLKLKNYKETNFNINREAINVYINMIKKKLIQKDSLINIIIAYHEKLSDIKLKDNLIELIKNSFDIIEPANIIKPIISKISKKNNAKLLIEYATFFGKLIEEYDVNDFPNKDIIDFCKILANNSNPQVRTSAISLLCILYKYLGKDVKTLTRDIKESTLKLIDAELDKVTVIDPKETLNKKKKAASVMESEDNKSGNNSKNANKDLIPPQDISKKITPDIIKLLNSGKWAERKQGCETIEKILTSANMRILPNGLNTLMTTIKKKLSDSNKNFVKMLIALLSKLIESMKSGFKQWAKPIALTLIPNLADKNQLMRNECQNCFDKWVEFTGFDSLVIHFPKFLSNDNAEIRIEIMNFFMKHKDRFKNSKSLAESVYKDMMNPLLICLQDRSSNVRN